MITTDREIDHRAEALERVRAFMAFTAVFDDDLQRVGVVAFVAGGVGPCLVVGIGPGVE